MTGTGRELSLAERIEQMRESDRRHAELMALPVREVCDCAHYGSDASPRPDPQCPDHGIRAAAARPAAVVDERQLLEDMGYDTYER
jgi:hypothetical protein